MRALGQPGDVLLLVTTQPQSPDILGAVEAAHERDMVVVALCGAKPGPLNPLLKDTDVLVGVPSERLPRIHEALVKGGALRADDRRTFGASWSALYRAPTQASPESARMVAEYPGWSAG